MPVTFAEVAKSEYILLTTFTKDGRPKPTAIWAAPDGDDLVVITQEKSWKVKRIRNTPRVTIATCDRGGKPKGEAVEAIAAILDKSANGATYDAIGKRYGAARQDVQHLLEAARGHEEERHHRDEGRHRRVRDVRGRGYSEKYLLLTTFTKDGRPKPTPVWGVPEGDKLLISTDDGSWKTKRINNTPRVTIQKCGVARQAQGRAGGGGGAQSAEVRDPAGVRHGDQALLVARVVVDSAGNHARGRRQGAQRDRGQAV